MPTLRAWRGLKQQRVFSVAFRRLPQPGVGATGTADKDQSERVANNRDYSANGPGNTQSRIQRRKTAKHKRQYCTR